jgi:endonuclease/exonuclease/phosphatase family metal-dependent hydrolase
MRQSTKTWRVCLATAALLTAMLTVAPATPAAADARYTFLQFNMAGNANHGGATTDIVPAVVASLRSSWPTAVSLNEVCRNQYDKILWDANAAGGGYTGYFAQIWPAGGSTCRGGAYGLALLLRGHDAGGFTEHPLPFQPGQEPRKFICGDTGWAGQSPRLGVCSTHLAPGDTNWKHDQMRHIGNTVLIPFAQHGNAVAFMGDTYLSEAEMRWYTGGHYTHLALGHTMTNDDCTPTVWSLLNNTQWAGECANGTLTRQSDYVMVTTNRSYNRSGGVTHTYHSDHLPVRGAASFRTP